MEVATKLTPTVEAVLGQDPDRVVSARDVITAILGNHPEYGAGTSSATPVPWPATTGAVARANEYLGWILDLYDGEALGGLLHGRAAVLGAGLVDRGVGRAMASVGLFQAIANEVDDFARTLGDDGQARYESIPLAHTHLAGPTHVLGRSESGGITGGVVAGQSRDGRWIVVGKGPVLTLHRGTNEVLRQDLHEPIHAIAVDAAGRRIMVSLDSGWGVVDRTDDPPSFRTTPVDPARFGDGADPSTPPVHAAAADGSALFRASGTTALQLSLDGSVRAHVLTSGPPTSLRASPSGRWLVSTTSSGAMDLVDTRRGTSQVRPAPSTLPPPDLALAVGDDGTLARAGVDLSAVGMSGQGLQVGPGGTDVDDLAASRALAFSPNGAHVVAAGPSGGLTMLQASGLGVVVRLSEDDPVGHAEVAFSGDGHWLLAVRDDGSLAQWEVGLTPAPEPPGPVAYVSDRADGTGDDLVGIDHEVEAFASLIAARDLEPPLSVGIFGDWGSGKTFFMRRLRDRVEERSRTARESGLLQREVSFAKRIVQVEFNAWHYSEGELWAALVEHIFANLSLFGGEPESEVRKRQQHLVERMEDTEERRGKLARQRDAARERATSTSERLRELSREHAQAVEALRNEHARDLVDILAGATNTRLAERIDGLAARLGLAADVTTEGTAPEDDASCLEEAAALMVRLQEARSLLATASPLTAVRHGGGFRHSRLAMFLTILAVPAGAALGQLVALLPGSALDASAPAIGAITALLAAGAQWWTDQAGWVEARVVEAEALAAQLDQLVARAEDEHDAKRAALEKKLDGLATQIATVETEMARADLEHGRLEAELRETTPATVLASYIMERAASDDYRRHLGLHARIKEDFDRIASIMDEDRLEVRNAMDLEHEQRDADTRIDRIVLYIDDLDRCDAGKVVEVLAAVHLLLAFPLFVVVVGLDARWGSRALRAHYRDMFGDDGSIFADPQDYLEKIFQVPFWLAPLDPGQAAGFVAEIAGGGSSGAPVATAPVAATAPGDREPGSRAEVGRRGPSQDVGGTSTIRTALARPELNPASLRMDEGELAFLRRVAGMLGSSPRAVKRFVNVYRLAKSLASDPLDFATHRPGYGAPYEAVMVLLAIDTGLPDVGAALFRALAAWEPGASEPDVLGVCIRSLAASTNGPRDPREDESSADPGHAPGGSTVTSDDSGAGGGPARDAAATSSEDAVGRAAKSLLGWVGDDDDADDVSDLSMQLVRTWIPTISRYSYRARAHAEPVA